MRLPPRLVFLPTARGRPELRDRRVRAAARPRAMRARGERREPHHALVLRGRGRRARRRARGRGGRRWERFGRRAVEGGGCGWGGAVRLGRGRRWRGPVDGGADRDFVRAVDYHSRRRGRRRGLGRRAACLITRLPRMFPVNLHPPVHMPIPAPVPIDRSPVYAPYPHRRMRRRLYRVLIGVSLLFALLGET